MSRLNPSAGPDPARADQTVAAGLPRLSLHDSRQRRLVAFEPIDPAHVRIYYCGPTVYDLAHLGNLRANITADVLVRLLRVLYPRVTYVRNVTDVDDKINARAAALGIPITELTARTLADFHADLAALGVLPPDIEPRATAHVGEMIAMIVSLIERGHAYEAQGHVLFAVGRFAAYGALSGRDPEALLAGARVEVAPYKRDAGDFVLWKPSPSDLPGWDSPWGRGRPGWHIECSAMSRHYLGESFDIHGGGTDLIFPHHENERAQSMCAHPHGEFARYWVHNAMLLVDGEKMSKSLGNFLTVRDVLARAPAEAIRLLLLRTHYRSVLDFSEAGLAEARRELDRFYRALLACDGGAEAPSSPVTVPVTVPDAVPDAILAALADDLNTPACLAAMHRLAAAALAGDASAAAGLRAAGALLGLLGTAPDVWFQGGSDDAAEIEAAIEARRAARASRDFALADAIRAEWLARGVAMEDAAGGTTWRRVAAAGSAA